MPSTRVTSSERSLADTSRPVLPADADQHGQAEGERAGRAAESAAGHGRPRYRWATADSRHAAGPRF